MTSLRSTFVALLFLAFAGCGDSNEAPPPETVPIVVTQPADQSAVAGDAATFSVAATGAAPLAYQWASSTDGTTFAAIAGATGTSYSTGATALSQSGSFYRVFVGNSLGSATSSAARLTVTPAVVAPAITVQPADRTVTEPATATFSVTATGTTPTYEWQSSSDAGVTFTPVVGGPNAPSLAVIDTTAGQSGQRYRVRVSNSAGSVTSNSGLLTVNALPTAPLFTTQPVSQAVVAGASASFTVVAAGTPAPALQWRINGANLVNGAQAGGVCAGASVTGASSAALTLTAVPLGCSAAVFSAVASNGVNPDATSNGATLTVNAALAAPSITLQPASVTVIAPDPATFTAAASGTPSPTVQWQQSTDAGVTWANITAATSPGYTTPASVLADSGKRLRAVFTNGSGSVNSSAAILTVTAAAPSAPLDRPSGVAVDAAGNVYVGDTANNTIRKITPAGVVSTLAGLDGISGSVDGTGSAARFSGPQGVAVDAAGNVYVGDTGNHTIRKITPAGVVTTLAGLPGFLGSTDGTGSLARFNIPIGVAVDAAGNVYVGDTSNHTIRKITPAGVVGTLAGLAGNPGIADGTGSAANFKQPFGVAVDAAGNVYVADTSNRTIRKITPAGGVSTLAGSAGLPGTTDGTGGTARFQLPQGVAVDAAGNVYVGDTSAATIRAITPTGVVSTLAGSPFITGSTDGTGSAARFSQPQGVTVDAAGNVYVADRFNNLIRKITPAAVVTTFAQ